MFVTVLSVVVVLLVVLKLFLSVKHVNCKSKVCLVGKTALVTGGSSGIGYQIVLSLAQRGCKVIVADVVKDPDLLENIFKVTRSRNVVFKHVDLASFNSIRKLASDVIKEEEKLDILVNNAGIGNNWDVTEDGLDKVMQVNYFSAFLLTHLILDLLKKEGGRILFTSSVLSYTHQFSLEKLKPEAFSDFLNYSNSKFCLIAVGDIFAEKLKKYGITSNNYHPGMVNTDIFRTPNFKGSWWYWCGMNMLGCLAYLIGKTPEEGAQTAIYVVCAREVKDVTGEFFFETKQTFKPKLASDKHFCKALWEATEEAVKLTEEERI